ncbi:unnamed protein product, partial [Discosporangium mesarthrocarpum]
PLKRPDTPQRTVFATLAAGLALSPLAFGGTPNWFTNLFAVYVGGIALLWAVVALRRPSAETSAFRPLILPAALVILAIIWCFIQAWLPVPIDIAHKAWSETATLLGISEGSRLQARISVNPEASIAGALRLTGYCLVFLLCYCSAASERHALRLLALIAATGTIYALYGIGLELSESKYVLWYERDFESGNLSATFPNRNAFADYAALCLICGCALLYRTPLRHEDMSRGWRRALIAISLFYLRRNGWVLYAAAILFTAILMTHSRGGLIVTIIAIAMFAICVAGSTVNRRASLFGAAGIALFAGTLFAIAGGNTSDRFAKLGGAAAERLEIFRLTAVAIGDRPLLGTGLGTFSDIFARFRTETLLPRIDFAHNSYLENALEMGVPAAAAFYAGLGILLFLFVGNLRGNRQAHPYPALGISAMTIAFLHSMFDYTEQFPAVAITLAAILGIAASRSFN